MYLYYVKWLVPFIQYFCKFFHLQYLIVQNVWLVNGIRIKILNIICVSINQTVKKNRNPCILTVCAIPNRIYPQITFAEHPAM